MFRFTFIYLLIFAVCWKAIVDSQIPSQVDGVGGGELNKTFVQHLSSSMRKSKMSTSLQWLSSSAQFFSFFTRDNISIQAYHIKGKVQNNILDPKVIVFCAGWTETSLKYANYLQNLHMNDYHIFSFDLRGQGFSGLTGWDNGLMTHTSSLLETYVHDLEYFVQTYVRPISGTIIYSGNSFAAEIGLLLELKSPHTFSKLVLMAPCILPKVDSLTKFAIRAIRYVGVGIVETALAARLDHVNNPIPTTNSEENIAAWNELRNLAPQRLFVAGPSVGFIDEMIAGGELLLLHARNITAEVLILQAGVDAFVDNIAMSTFFTGLGGRSSRMIRLGAAKHEILMETDDVVDAAMEEIVRFLQLPLGRAPLKEQKLNGSSNSESRVGSASEQDL